MIRTRRAGAETLILLFIGIAPAEFNWAFNPYLVHWPVIFWSVDVFRFAVLPLFIFCWGISRRLFAPAEVGLHMGVFGRRKPNWGLFAAVMVAVPALLWWLDPYESRFSSQYIGLHLSRLFSYKQMMPAAVPTTGGLHALEAVYFSLTAACVEEFYFRGLARFVFGRGVIRSLLFLVCTTALFLPPHLYGGSANVAYAGVFALLAAILYLIVGNLWPLILGHFLIDLKYFI